MKDQNYDYYLREFCSELSLKGIDNFIHYLSDHVYVEIKNQTEFYDKGFYKPTIIFVEGYIKLYRTKNPFEDKE